MSGAWNTWANLQNKITPFAPKTNGNSWATDPLGIMAKPAAVTVEAATPGYDANAAQRALGAQATADSQSQVSVDSQNQAANVSGTASSSLLTGITPPSGQTSASKTLLGA